MPSYWNNYLVVSKEELVPMFFKTEQYLSVVLSRYKNRAYGMKSVCRGGRSRELLIDYDSLPKEIKTALGDPRKCDHILERYYKISADAVRFFNDYEFEDGSTLKQEHQEKYIVNASMLYALIALREDRIMELTSKKGSLTGLWGKMLYDANSFNEILWTKEKIRHTLPSGERQFKTIFKAFETGGLKSLISSKHKNNNSRKVTDETLFLLRNMFADKQIKPTATEIQRQYDSFITGYTEVINNETGECYNPKDFKKLSKATINAYLSEWVSKLATHQKRSDNRQLNMGKFKPFYSFEMPKFAGSILSIDDRQPPFKTLGDKRIWFYLGVDIASRAITCWVYGESKEGIITEFYRQLVRNYASWGFCLPAELECEMSLNSSFKSTFLREGVMFEDIKMEANNARGKYIERVNGELRYRKEKGKVGFLARPKALSEANQPGADIEKVERLPYERIKTECLQDIEDWNNEPHPTEKNISKWEYFTTRQHADLKPINYKGFLKHIGYRTNTSCKLGNIQLNNDWFLIADNGKVAKGDKLIQHMREIEGKSISVYWLDDNEGHVLKALAYLNGEYQCELVKKPRPNRAKIERNEQDEQYLQELASYTNTVDSFAKKQMQQLEKVTIINNEPKPERKFKIDSLTAFVNVEQAVEILPPAPDEDKINDIQLPNQSLLDRF